MPPERKVTRPSREKQTLPSCCIISEPGTLGEDGRNDRFTFQPLRFGRLRGRCYASRLWRIAANDKFAEYGRSIRNALSAENSQGILPSDIHYCSREWSLISLP